MRAIRSQDGCVYHLSQADLPRPPTIEAFHSVLSEHAEIPISALIVMHPNGRQVDRDSLALLLQDNNNAEDSDKGKGKGKDKDNDNDKDDQIVYLFDREVLTLDLDSQEGYELLNVLSSDIDHVLNDVGNDADRQFDASMDFIQCIRHQHLALTAALHNLERHRGGRQEAITAYNHFASPLLTKYKDLLAVYPACMALVSKVRVSAKMQTSPSANTPAKERFLSDFVSRDKMENVRDGCQRTLDEIMTKHSDLEKLLKDVAEGTDKLKIDKDERFHVDDLVECEHDATEAHARVRHLLSRPEPRTDEDEDELDTILDECVARLRFLVERRNAETRQLLQSLQEIARLQSQIASAPELISALNQDLKSKTDSFKHLARLQLLVPAYAATLAESTRRRAFTKYLTSSSSAYAELFGKLTSDERRRRGIYQAEWAGKLPWDLPGLDEGLASIEVELRSSNPSLAQRTADADVTLEDLIALEQSLLDMQDNLSPEDMPVGGLPHPVKETIALIDKLKKGIESLQQDFEKMNGKLEYSETSPTTSVSVTASTNEALQALEERRTQLERDLQAERSAREAEVAALTVRNSELEKHLADGATERASLQKSHEREQEEAVQAATATARAHQASLDEQIKVARQAEERLTHVTNEVDRLKKELQQTKEYAENVQYDLEAQERRGDQLEKRKQDLLQALGEKDRLLRDHRTEAELDRATLEKELAEAKEKLISSEQEFSDRLKGLEDNQESTKQKMSQQENDLAELQTMCDERGRGITDMRSEAQAVNVKVRTLLGLCQAYHSQCFSFLGQFIREDVGKPGTTSTSQSTSRVRGPAGSFDVGEYSTFDDSSLENAIAFMQDDKSRQVWSVAKAQCDFCLHEVKKWQKECKRYRDRMEKAVSTSRDKLAFRSFHQNDLALFLPTKNKDATQRIFAAFNFGRPNYFLKPTGRLIPDVEDKDWIVARITSISEGVVSPSEDSNPYSLRAGSKYFMLEAEYWPNVPHRLSQRTASASRNASAPQAGTSGMNNEATPGQMRMPVDQAVQANESDIADAQAQNSSDTGIDSPARIISPKIEESDAQDGVKESSTPEMVLDTSYMTVTSPIDDSTMTIAQQDSESSSRIGAAAPSSSLSSSRPPKLDEINEQSSPTTQVKANDTAIKNNALKPTSTITESNQEKPLPDEAPAFLPSKSEPVLNAAVTAAIPRSIPRSTSNTMRPVSASFSRSFGSSNGSGGSTGNQGRLSSSSYLTPSKAPATIAASPSYTTPEELAILNAVASGNESGKTPRRTSQTIGRYSGKSSLLHSAANHRRQSSASGASPSSPPSATDLLRSFTMRKSTS